MQTNIAQQSGPPQIQVENTEVRKEEESSPPFKPNDYL